MGKVKFGRYQMPVPETRWVRVSLGVILVIFGIFGFLPILGFWMIPLGLIILSVDLPVVRRWRRQLTVWWHRRKDEKAAKEVGASAPRARSPGPEREHRRV